jgi:ribosomal protein L36
MGIKHTTENVKEILKGIGYTLISPEYLGNHRIIAVMCSKDHLWNTRFSDIYNAKQRCPECQGIKRFSVEEVVLKFKERGYVANLTKYVNARKHINATCPNGHSWSVSYFKFLSGQECPNCLNCNIKFTFNKVKECIENKGFGLLSTQYIEANSKLRVICSKNHSIEISFSEFRKREYPCSRCRPLSKPERYLFDIIKEEFPNTKKTRHANIKIKDKPYLKGFEIDIHVPELHKGIEFDGRYYHSYEHMRKSKINWPDDDIKNYHQIKDDYFASKGIEILHIKEEDWIENKEDCVQKCLLFLKGEQNVPSTS